MRNILKRLPIVFVLIILTSLPVLVQAQIGDPGCDPDCNCKADGTPCPIDGGLGVLLATGVFYGIKKVRDTRKKQMFISRN